MKAPNPTKTAQAAIRNIDSAVDHLHYGEPKHAQLLINDAMGLLERTKKEITAENVDHEYIGVLCQHGEYDVAQTLARYKRNREKLLNND